MIINVLSGRYGCAPQGAGRADLDRHMFGASSLGLRSQSLYLFL